ncbi:hypothetical protein NKR23_g4793 [Pleurostoma richardsiae]|uniref:Uncharacterized protein n=1 Tax=Pleurostoma richardsiae TaxID=41990 RepID=A0AA38RU45_9PEZI|nr:hypothetical protein NKR23_g4793 [Pleurostoma richardsiae]
MGDQVQFDRASWRLAVLVPAWTAQTSMLLCLMGIFSYRLAETLENFEENDKKGNFPTVEVVWECVNIGFSLLSLILTILEIARVTSERLTPMTMLFTHIIKLTCSFAILALDIVVYTARSEGHWSAVGLAIDCGLIFSTLISGIYAVRVYRRVLKYDDYDLPEGKAGTPIIQIHPPDIELGHSVDISAQYGRQGNTPFTDVDTSYAQQGGLSFKDEVDRAIGAEFGWGGTNAASAVERSGSVVASGVVPDAKGKPEMNGRPRMVSWGSERGLIGVPEGELDEHDGTKRGLHIGGEEDRQALLGRGRTMSEGDVGDIGLLGLDSRKRRRES